MTRRKATKAKAPAEALASVIALGEEEPQTDAAAIKKSYPIRPLLLTPEHSLYNTTTPIEVDPAPANDT
jgi:hypothetical protein